jgi:hypothetical protein
MMPLALTDSEMDIVMRAAQPLAVQDRDAFLRDIAERLAALPHLGDARTDQRWMQPGGTTEERMY